MRMTLIFFFAVTLLAGNHVAEAQLLRKLKNAAEAGVSRAMERTVEKQVAKATERQLEKAFGNLYGDEAGAMGGGADGANFDFSKIMGSINMDVETETNYHFTGYAEMEITSTDEKGKSSEPVTFHSLTSQDDYYGMLFLDEQSKKDNEKTVMIFDQKNQATVMLMENKDEKSSMAFSMDWEGMMEGVEIPEDEEGDTPNMDDFEYEKTGNTKSILGYTCDEYRVSNEDMEGTYWISQSEIEGFVTLWGKNNPFITKKLKSENASYFDQMPEGNLMEMDFKNKKDQSSSQLKMVAIEENSPVSFNLEEYPNPMKEAK